MKKIFFSMLFAFLAIAMSGVAGVVTLSPDAGAGAVWYRIKAANSTLAGKYVYAKAGEQLYCNGSADLALNQLWCFVDFGESGLGIANGEIEGWLTYNSFTMGDGTFWEINETLGNNGYGIANKGSQKGGYGWWNQAGGRAGTRIGDWSSNENDAGSAWLFEEVDMNGVLADVIAAAENTLAGLEIGEKTLQVSAADKAAFAEAIAAAKETQNTNLMEVIKGLEKAKAEVLAARVQPIPVELADGERFMLKEVNADRYIVKSGDRTWKEHKVTFDPEGELIDFGGTSADFPEGKVTPEKAIIIARVDDNGLRFLDASTTTDEKEGRIRVSESLGFIKVYAPSEAGYMQYATITKNTEGLYRIQTGAGFLCANLESSTNIAATSDENAFVFDLVKLNADATVAVTELTEAINAAKATISKVIAPTTAADALNAVIAEQEGLLDSLANKVTDEVVLSSMVANGKLALKAAEEAYVASALIVPSTADAPIAYHIKNIRGGKYLRATAADEKIVIDVEKAGNAEQLWYFVASGNGYKIYNMKFADASIKQADRYMMAAEGTEWQINTIFGNNGYGIGVAGASKTDQSWWNQFGGGTGIEVGGWTSNENDGGSSWLFEKYSPLASVEDAIVAAETLLEKTPVGEATYNVNEAAQLTLKLAISDAKDFVAKATGEETAEAIEAAATALNEAIDAFKAARVQPVAFEPEENDLYLIRRVSDDSTLNLGWSTQWSEYKLTYDSIGTVINDEHSVEEALFFVGIAKEGEGDDEKSYYVFKENTADQYVRIIDGGYMNPAIDNGNVKSQGYMHFAKNQDGQIRIEVKGKYVTEKLGASADETIFPFVFEKQEISGADLKLTAVIAEADSIYNKENVPTVIGDTNVERAAFAQAIADAKALLANEEATQLQFLKESEVLAEKIKLYQAAVEAAASVETAVTAAETEAAKVYVTENIEAYVDKAEADAFAVTYNAAISAAKEMLAADTATTALLTAAATDMTAATETYVEAVTDLLLNQYQVVIDSATALYNDVKQGADAYQASAAARKSIFNAVKNANTVKTNAIQNPATSYNNDRASVQVGIVNIYDAITKFRGKVVKSEELSIVMAKAEDILNSGNVNADLSAALEEAELVINEAEEAVAIAKLNGLIASEGIDVLAGVNVYAAEGAIVVEGAEGAIRVVAINGSLVANVEAEAVTTISVEAGTYVVVVNGKSVKVLVK